MKKNIIAAIVAGAAAVGLTTQFAKSEDLNQEANKILNSSLGSVGQRVIVTVSSPGTKDNEYHAQIPNDKYSPPGDDTPLSIVEVTKRVNAAIQAAKKNKTATTITIKIETKVKK